MIFLTATEYAAALETGAVADALTMWHPGWDTYTAVRTPEEYTTARQEGFTAA